MSVVQVRTIINAAPERVWDTVMDSHRFEEWVTIHRQLKSSFDGSPRTGAEMEQVLQIRGVRFTVKWELDQCDAPRLAVWRGRGPAGSRAVTRYELTEQADGSTCFDYTNEFTAPGGMLGKAAGLILVEGVSEREAHASLDRLKRLVEN